MTNITVQDVTDTKKKVTFEVPVDRVNDLIDSQYRDLKKSVQIKGFRKGKVPLDLVRSYFKKQVESEAARKIIDETFEPGLQGEKIIPVTVLSLEPEDFEDGKPFKYIAEIEVPPNIEVSGFKELKLKKTIRKLEETDVDERLDRLREGQAKLSPVSDSRAVAEGDHLLVDINARSESGEIQSLTVSEYHMELGRNFYLPDFDSKLEGMQMNDPREVTVEFPDDVPNKELAGKSATFGITIKEVKERILPELDDDFAKDLGEFGSLEQLKDEIRNDLARMQETQTRKEMEDQIAEGLLEKNEFDVPESMIENQIDAILEQTLRNLALQGIDPKRLPPPTQEQRDNVRPSAEKAVKVTLMLRAISEQEEIEVSDEQFEEAMRKSARELGVSEDYYRDQLEKNNMLDDVRSTLLMEEVLKMIEENAEVTEVEPAEAEEESKDQKSEKE